MRLCCHRTTTKVFGDPRIKNEDYYLPRCNREVVFQRFVMCDGATSSYAARAWAEELAMAFEPCGEATEKERVFNAAKQYESKFPVSSLAGMDHSTIEAFKRGSSATLLVVEQDKSNPLLFHLTAVGDTCAFVIDGNNRIIDSFPLNDAKEFSTSAYLVTATFEGLKLLFDEKTKDFYWKTKDILLPSKQGCKILCATDAVAQWIAANKETPRNMERFFKAVRNHNKRKFAGFIEYERSKGAMPVDDSSVALLEP